MKDESKLQIEIECESILNALPEAVFVLAPGGRVLHANQTAVERYGYSLEELRSKSASDLAATELRSQAREHLATALISGDQFEWLHVTRHSKVLPVEIYARGITFAGNPAVLSSVRDISERKRLEDQIRDFAYHDQLTQLPNRRLLADRLSQVVSSNKRKGCFGAVLFIDLDNFKPINDLHGHDAGDLLLIEVGKRLSAAVRSIDTVARLGGDEFVVLLGELYTDSTLSETQALGVGEKLRSLLAEPYKIWEKHTNGSSAIVECQCTASIGVSLFDQHVEIDDVLRPADIAMYQAKQTGGNSVSLHSIKVFAK